MCRVFKILLQLTVTGLVAGLMLSCGAKLKTADQVSHIFKNTQSLDDKVLNLCGVLQKRSSAPTLVGVSLADDLCGRPAGLSAQQLRDLKADEGVGFANVVAEHETQSSNTGGISDPNKFCILKTRTQIWVNRSLISLLQLVMPMLKEKSDSNTNDGKPKKFNFAVIGKSEFDKDNWTFHVEFNLTSTKEQNGSVNIANRFVADAQLFDKVGAATVETAGETDSKTSLLNKGKILAVAIPHAGDIYLDIITDLRLHDYGVCESMKKEVTKTISDALKMIPETLQEAEDKVRTGN